MDIFYFYLIQYLKHKEKIEKRKENLYIQRFSLYIEKICSVLYFRGPFRERCWRIQRTECCVGRERFRVEVGDLRSALVVP
jgi:hypothetical protein